jgi:hypothetical protein
MSANGAWTATELLVQRSWLKAARALARARSRLESDWLFTEQFRIRPLSEDIPHAINRFALARKRFILCSNCARRRSTFQDRRACCAFRSSVICEVAPPILRGLRVRFIKASVGRPYSPSRSWRRNSSTACPASCSRCASSSGSEVSMSPTIRCLSAETSNRYLCFGAVSRSARARSSPSQSILKPLMLRAINVVHRDRQLYHAIVHGISAIVLCPKGDWFPNFLGNDYRRAELRR